LQRCTKNQGHGIDLLRRHPHDSDITKPMVSKQRFEDLPASSANQNIFLILVAPDDVVFEIAVLVEYFAMFERNGLTLLCCDTEAADARDHLAKIKDQIAARRQAFADAGEFLEDTDTIRHLPGQVVSRKRSGQARLPVGIVKTGQPP